MADIIWMVGITMFCMMSFAMLMIATINGIELMKKALRYSKAISLESIKLRDDAIGNFRVCLSPTEHTLFLYWMTSKDADPLKETFDRFYLTKEERENFYYRMLEYREIRSRIRELEREWELDTYGKLLSYNERHNIVDRWMGVIYDFDIEDIEKINKKCAKGYGSFVTGYNELAVAA